MSKILSESKRRNHLGSSAKMRLNEQRKVARLIRRGMFFSFLLGQLDENYATMLYMLGRTGDVSDRGRFAFDATKAHRKSIKYRRQGGRG